MQLKQLLILFLVGACTVQANTLKDPTQPKSALLGNGQDPNAMAKMALKLTAIIDNSKTKHAIINGKSFAQGQQVQGYKIIVISQNHVILDGSNGKQTLYVNNNNIKKDTNNGF